jgi:hypothetical protein
MQIVYAQGELERECQRCRFSYGVTTGPKLEVPVALSYFVPGGISARYRALVTDAGPVHEFLFMHDPESGNDWGKLLPQGYRRSVIISPVRVQDLPHHLGNIGTGAPLSVEAEANRLIVLVAAGGTKPLSRDRYAALCQQDREPLWLRTGNNAQPVAEPLQPAPISSLEHYAVVAKLLEPVAGGGKATPGELRFSLRALSYEAAHAFAAAHVQQLAPRATLTNLRLFKQNYLTVPDNYIKGGR